MSDTDSRVREDVVISVERMMRFCLLAQMTFEYASGDTKALPLHLTRFGVLVFETASFLYSLFEFEPALTAFACLKKNPSSFISSHKKRQKSLAFWVEQIQSNSFHVSGKELQTLGIQPGRRMGEMVKKAFLLPLHNRLKDSQAILSLLKASL